MLKKMVYVLFLAFILSGCNENPNKQIATAEGIEIRIIEDFEALELEQPYRIYTPNPRTLHLSNVLTGEIKTIFEFETYREIISSEVQAIAGYYSVMVISGDDTHFATTGFVSDLFAVEFIIFDDNLNILEAFRITEEDGSIFSSLLMSFGDNQIVKQDDEWLVKFNSTNWMFGQMEKYFYSYNLNTQELTLMTEVEGSNFVGNMHIIPMTNQLSFVLTHFESEMISHVEFGFIDLDTFELNIVYSVDTPTTPVTNVFGEYLVISEIWIDEDALESEVVLIHSLTGEVTKVPLFGYRSVWSSLALTSNNRFLFTTRREYEYPHPNWSKCITRARLYDVQTGDIAFEYMLIAEDTLNENEETGNFTLFSNVAENIYIISVDIWEVDDLGIDIGRIRVEYMIIEIVESDDE